MTGDWKGVGRILSTAGNGLAWKRAKKRAVLKEAHRLRGIMVGSFNKGGPPGKRWKRLSVFTQLVSRAQGKGDRRPLMDSGSLRNSHSVVEVDDDTVFVGVHRTAIGKGKRGRDKQGRFVKAGPGSPLMNIALVHEHGSKPIYINVSPGSASGRKVRKFFLWLHKKTGGVIKPLRKNTVGIVVRIPPRPWIGPIWEREGDNAARNIMRDTVAGLGVPGISNLIR
jgi:hypothetical protein